MLTFLSDEWIAALHEAATADRALAATTAEVALTVEQCVTDGPEGEVRYHVRFDHGRVAVVAGPAADATIRFTTDRATAAGIAQGQLSAQRAFMTGRLRVGGDLRAVLDHQPVLAALGDAFASVRARTAPVEPEEASRA